MYKTIKFQVLVQAEEETILQESRPSLLPENVMGNYKCMHAPELYPETKCEDYRQVTCMGPVYMEPSYPASRVSRKSEFPGKHIWKLDKVFI